MLLPTCPYPYHSDAFPTPPKKASPISFASLLPALNLSSAVFPVPSKNPIPAATNGAAAPPVATVTAVAAITSVALTPVSYTHLRAHET